MTKRPEFSTSPDKYRNIESKLKSDENFYSSRKVLEIYCPNDKKLKKKLAGSQSPQRFRNTSPQFYKNEEPRSSNYNYLKRDLKNKDKILNEVETSVKTISFFKEFAGIKK